MSAVISGRVTAAWSGVLHGCLRLQLTKQCQSKLLLPFKLIYYNILMYYDCTHFFKIKRRTIMIDRPKAAMMGPITHTIPASSVFRLTETPPELSRGTFGSGLLGGSPGGAERIFNERGSENGLLVYRC